MNSQPLVALSIRQPWMDMIIRGVKTMEIRSWRVQRRGLIALHAPRRIDFSAAHFYGYRRPWTLERGKIVAIAYIADAVDLDVSSWEKCVALHRQPLPVMEGTYGVMLNNVRQLERPISYKGRQMLFPLPKDVEDRVRKLAGLGIRDAAVAEEQDPQGDLFG